MDGWKRRNVGVLGAASLLNDVASEMVAPVLPVFVAVSLGGGASAVGAVEGVADAAAAALKWAAGIASDRAGRARPFVVVGYALAAAVRPALALAQVPGHVLGVRVVDRVGKGLRTAPRDALLAASVPEAQRGAAFGFHRSMDHLGATIGPLVTVAVLTWWTQDLRVLFVLSAIPGAAAALVTGLTQEVVREAPAARGAEVVGPSLAPVLAPIALATLGTASDAFLLLKAGVADGAPLTALPLLWTALHLVRTMSALPGGWLADRLSARTVTALGWAVRGTVFAGLASATTPVHSAVGLVAYGLAGVSEGAEKKWIGSFAGPDRQGSAFGAYHGVVGVAALPASLGFGVVWDTWGPAAAFATSAALIGAALGLLLVGPRLRSAGGG